MTMNLYRVAATSNSVNKLAGATFVGSRELTTFNDFRYDDSSFVLSDEPSFNYVTFIGAHDILFCGYITGMVRTNGLYHYYVKNDMLEMAYQAGAFNTSVYCTHSIYGSDYLFDQRVGYIERVSVTSPYNLPRVSYNGNNFYVALNVLGRTLPGTGNPLQSRIANMPGIFTYILTFGAFQNFLSKFSVLSADNQKKFGPSILGAYILPSELINRGEIKTQNEHTIVLYSYESSDDTSTGYESKNVVLDNTYTVEFFAGHPINTTIQLSYCPNVEHTFETPIELYGYRKKGTFSMDIYGGNNIHGTLNSLNVDRITSIGYKAAINYTSMTVKYILLLNGNERYDIAINGKIQELFPIGYDSTYTSWTTYASQALATATSVFLTASSAMTGNIGGTVLSGTAAAASAAQLAQTIEASNIGGYSISGSTGGTTDIISGYRSNVIFSWNNPIDLENFQAKYGKPDFHMRDLTGYHGYVRTENARLYDPRGKLTIPDRLLDTTINSEGIFIL